MINKVQQPEFSQSAPAPAPGSVKNVGEPIILNNVEQIAGFTAEAARPGEKVKIWTKMALTSDDPLFYRLVENAANVIRGLAQKEGITVNIDQAKTVLLVIKPNDTAELWVDTAAVCVICAVKRDVKVGTVIFENDIADIRGMAFPCVEFGEKDKVLCIFRDGWRFGFAFDANPDEQLDTDAFNKMLGSLVREMRYTEIYKAVANEAVINQIIASGWFPFVEIINDEFRNLLNHHVSGLGLGYIEPDIISKFDEARLQHILNRWIAKPIFSNKREILNEAVDAFISKRPVTVIKIILTEIEGILNDAYRAENGGQGAKIRKLLEFAEESAEKRAGGINTLFLPKVFSHYLSQNTFSNFDPVASTGNAASRHAVSHGAAAGDTYTMTRALQAILTLDQLAFYI